MLVVRQRRAPVAAPPLQTVPGVGPGQKNVEGDKENARVEALTHSLGQSSVERAGYRGSPKFLRTTRVVCIGTERVPSEEEEEREDREGEEAGPGAYIFSFAFPPLLFSLGAKFPRGMGAISFVFSVIVVGESDYGRLRRSQT